MADRKHIDILWQGVDVWNEWREKHPEVQPKLREVDISAARLDLTGANLIDADLSHADLFGADLSGANLRGADLSHANLRGADLSHANLFLADLSGANLRGTNLSHADLSHTDLIGANLIDADLIGADLSDVNLSDARVGWIIFADLDLSTVQGLETVKHDGPSTIGIDTIYKSGGNIPEIFLRGAGVPDTFIRSLVGKPIEYNSCFISYSSKDQDFAERLYADLQAKNVRCWFAPEDLKIGDKFRIRIDESIRLYDKLLLILSEHSVRSPWVETEVETAFEKEHKSGKLALFPVKLDNTVMETDQAWAADIRRTRYIGDFTRWKEHDEYQKGLKRLLRDLKQEALHDTIESDADRD